MPITPTHPFKGRHFPGEVILLCVRWYQFEDRPVVLIRPALQRSIDHVGGMTVFGGHIATVVRQYSVRR